MFIMLNKEYVVKLKNEEIIEGILLEELPSKLVFKDVTVSYPHLITTVKNHMMIIKKNSIAEIWEDETYLIYVSK